MSGRLVWRCGRYLHSADNSHLRSWPMNKSSRTAPISSTMTRDNCTCPSRKGLRKKFMISWENAGIQRRVTDQRSKKYTCSYRGRTWVMIPKVTKNLVNSQTLNQGSRCLLCSALQNGRRGFEIFSSDGLLQISKQPGGICLKCMSGKVGFGGTLLRKKPLGVFIQFMSEKESQWKCSIAFRWTCQLRMKQHTTCVEHLFVNE